MVRIKFTEKSFNQLSNYIQGGKVFKLYVINQINLLIVEVSYSKSGKKCLIVLVLVLLLVLLLLLLLLLLIMLLLLLIMLLLLLLLLLVLLRLRIRFQPVAGGVGFVVETGRRHGGQQTCDRPRPSVGLVPISF